MLGQLVRSTGFAPSTSDAMRLISAADRNVSAGVFAIASITTLEAADRLVEASRAPVRASVRSS